MRYFRMITAIFLIFIINFPIHYYLSQVAANLLVILIQQLVLSSLVYLFSVKAFYCIKQERLIESENYLSKARLFCKTRGGDFRSDWGRPMISSISMYLLHVTQCYFYSKASAT